MALASTWKPLVVESVTSIKLPEFV